MIRQISKEQIQDLFSFVRKRGVQYVDVQHELVDHIASAVEVEMNAHPNWTYEQCLDIVYSRFPRSGFVHFVQEKEKAMTSYWNTRQWEYLKTYFTLPTVMMTIACLLALWTFLYFVSPVLGGGLIGLLMLASFWQTGGYSRDDSVSNNAFLYWEPLLIIGMGALLFIASQHTNIGWMAGLLAVQGLFMMIKRRYAIHDFVDRRKVLVLATFYRSHWIILPMIIVFPMVWTGGHILSTMQYSLAKSGFIALLMTIAVAYLHALVYHLRPSLQEELDLKYPHIQLST